MTVAFTLTWYKLGLELLEGTEVKAIAGREGANGERADERAIESFMYEGQPEIVGELNPAEQEEEAQTVPRSKYQEVIRKHR